jgi:transcription-repair coupling factor (superfamily II helicase)
LTHPAVRDLLQSAARHPAFQAMARWASSVSGAYSLSGLTLTAKALYLALLWQVIEQPMLILTGGAKQAEALTELLQTFFEALVLNPQGRRVQQIPALDVLPGSGMAPHTEITEQRAIGLHRLVSGTAPLTVAPAGSALLKVAAPAAHRRLSVSLRTGEDVPMSDLVAHLDSIGYERREPVEMVGEFSVRGGILDVFPVEADRPVRIEFFGDTVESMRTFDVETQRSVLKIAEVMLLPLRETPRTASDADLPADSSLLDQSPHALIVVDEPEEFQAASVRLWKRIEEGAPAAAPHFLRYEELAEKMERSPRLLLYQLALDPSTPHLSTRPSLAFHNNMQVAVAEARSLAEQGQRVAIFAASLGELERLADIFSEYSAPFQLALDPSDASAPYLKQRAYSGPGVNILLTRGLVRRGVHLPDSNLALIGSEDLFETPETVARPAVRASQMGAFAADLGDLKPGDYVVHATHGIGQFLGIRELAQGDLKGDFMLLEYSAGARLYVPLARMDLVQKFRGAGDAAPALDKLGGTTWERTKTRVKAKMRDMAEELLRLYAQRKMAEGHAYSPDSNWQREFEDAFEFSETRDQLAAIQDIKRDMELTQPMDRLLCGDVGYGKTEVAMRAAFKALGDGKQVAVLAPTTVLSFQHFETFKRRFAPFPVRVEMFSRFRSAKELKVLAEEVAEGKIDIAIGTHRLLSDDIRFRDLGLLVVDEEQRFGVKHKEKLKQLRQNVDVLTMSATPIPRTLHMSLLGLRDLSVIETPPKDRLAIHTVVARFDPALVRTAIEQELARGGQVYFLHNKVQSIWQRAAWIQELVPEAKLGVGHGQLAEAALEKVMLGFMRHEFDVLVSTTIVENGLDIPLANTIIIENAERYGLSELYQLRGRVGRSNRRAYAYLLVPEDTELTEVARKRLAALREFSDLGAGFKIAALDLELRGAGNLLGGEQHGHINAVGYDVYMSLLEQTVQELRGEYVPPEIHTTVNLGLDLRIPSPYISDDAQRLRAYKRIASAASPEDAAKIQEELSDRYGAPPEHVRLLLDFSVIKSRAEKLGIESIERRQGFLNIKFHPGAAVDPAKLMDLVRKAPDSQFTPNGVLRMPAEGTSQAELLRSLEQRLASLATVKPQETPHAG